MIGDFARNLQQRVDEYDRFIAETEKQLARLKELRQAAALLLASEVATLSQRVAPHIPGKPYENMAAVEAAEIVLVKNKNQAMSVEDITNALIKGGWKTTAQEPKMSVTGALVRDRRFERVGSSMYRLKDIEEEGPIASAEETVSSVDETVDDKEGDSDPIQQPDNGSVSTEEVKLET